LEHQLVQARIRTPASGPAPVAKAKESPISKRKSAGPGSRRRAVPSAPQAFDPIEAALRQLYDNMVAEPIPDDFLRILDRLAEAEERRED